MKTGPKPGALINKRAKRNARDVIQVRIDELIKRGDEPSKAEAARLAVQLLPHEAPRLQAVMARIESAGDTLTRLLKEIDGGTVGIARGITASRPLLEAKQPVLDIIEGGSEDSIP